ncbi:bifunctional diaminohydroxyphosphoribosylaminopyrimidine deaminase/5-amino-6-(5-phosphoribosylamino)uracil reductase RibD [Pelistega sp. NLN82]|uniref:Riboflavin biosynthesis protein RibD n=2 Tax=Pelistega ratti TaxID=2652177 RepID=A0A6L9Y602_9BURK|nr:bifunctional diaminohydroxyphosphoribosylaminopyrimidine deaminase/5-amino-6-(5-phosphoribosylamino)uracil reductase RibD [Pelistega ratti]
MQQALSLAESVLTLTDPNPRVGCVIVKDDQMIAQGATQKVGGPHAEVMAIRDAKTKGFTEASLQNTTFYVTLEPCSHYGRTPPCVEAIIQLRPKRVVIATLDPNPLVAGKGIQRLIEAGIEVSYPLMEEEALALNVGFMARMAEGKPWVWSKIACSLDGKIALENGVSQWITEEPARVDGQYWRARSSLVLTGIGTILKDNPLLNVRSFPTERQPIRAVIDGQFLIPEDAALFNGDPVWIFTYQSNPEKVARLQAKNAKVFNVPEKNSYVDLVAIWQIFQTEHINEIHVEAGVGLNSALLRAGLMDELLIYMAPKLIGSGKGSFSLPVLESLDNVPTFEWVEQQQIGNDMRLRLRNSKRWVALLSQINRKI